MLPAVLSPGVYGLGIGIYLFALLLVSALAGGFAVWRRQTAGVFVSGLLPSVVVCVAWVVWSLGSLGTLLQINVLLLAGAALLWTLIDLIYPAGVPRVRIAGRPVVFAHLAVTAAVGMLGMLIAVQVVRRVFELPDRELQRLDWLALAATAASVTIGLWDRTARFSLAGLYCLAWIFLAMGEIARGTLPGLSYAWVILAEWSGLLLVIAIIGWLLRWPRMAAALRIPGDDDRWSDRWFLGAQAIMLAVIALLAGWIASDFSVDGMGTALAIFGFRGRVSVCPSALMLVGTSIVMAWQSSGRRRAAWQFMAMAAGVFFTTSIGWARIDAATETPWFDRSVNLTVSTGMMSLMTWIGLPRVLPKKSDWVARGRQATPVFATAALLLLAVVLLQKFLQIL